MPRHPPKVGRQGCELFAGSSTPSCFFLRSLVAKTSFLQKQSIGEKQKYFSILFSQQRRFCKCFYNRDISRYIFFRKNGFFPEKVWRKKRDFCNELVPNKRAIFLRFFFVKNKRKNVAAFNQTTYSNNSRIESGVDCAPCPWLAGGDTYQPTTYSKKKRQLKHNTL